MTTYTVVWTPDDPSISSVTFTETSFITAKQDAWDMLKSYSPGVSTAIITADDGTITKLGV